VPVCGTIWWSTRAGSIFGGTQFVGLENFIQLPGVVGAGSAIANTLVFALISVPLILIGALGVALVLARIKHGGSIYRFLVYFPGSGAGRGRGTDLALPHQYRFRPVQQRD